MLRFIVRSFIGTAGVATALTVFAAFVGWIVTGNHVGSEFALRMGISVFAVFFGIDMIALISLLFRDKSERLDT